MQEADLQTADHVKIVTDDKKLDSFLGETERIGEECGVFAIFTAEKEVNFKTGLEGAKALQHRGQQGAGVVAIADGEVKRYVSQGKASDVFTDEIINNYADYPATATVFQDRYATGGGYDNQNTQPCIAIMRDGTPVTVSHNGGMIILDSSDNNKFSEKEGKSDTVIFTEILARSEGKTNDEKLLNALAKVDGSYFMVITIGDTGYVARNDFGGRTGFEGRLNGAVVYSSETNALEEVGAEIIREVQPGEVTRIDGDQTTIIREKSDIPRAFCSMEPLYFMRENSLYTIVVDGKVEIHKVEDFRRRAGRELARENTVDDETIVIPIPNTGKPYGEGFAEQSGAPLVEAITTENDIRTYQNDQDSKKQAEMVNGKLRIQDPKGSVKGKKVKLIDDSVIRGNTSKPVIEAIFALGADEVHLISSYPPPQYTCHLGTGMRTNEEQIYWKYNGDLDAIANHLGASSIAYISEDGFARALTGREDINFDELECTPIQACGFCDACITGKYPVDVNGNRPDFYLNPNQPKMRASEKKTDTNEEYYIHYN